MDKIGEKLVEIGDRGHDSETLVNSNPNLNSNSTYISNLDLNNSNNLNKIYEYYIRLHKANYAYYYYTNFISKYIYSITNLNDFSRLLPNLAKLLELGPKYEFTSKRASSTVIHRILAVDYINDKLITTTNNKLNTLDFRYNYLKAMYIKPLSDIPQIDYKVKFLGLTPKNQLETIKLLYL